MASSRKEARHQERKQRRKLRKAEAKGKSRPSSAQPEAMSETKPSRFGFLFVLAGALAIGAWMFFPNASQESGDAARAVSSMDAPAIPDPPTADMTLPVRRMIEEARADVGREPSAARTWGELGEVLDAHHLFEDAATCYRYAVAISVDSRPDQFRWNYLLATVLNSAGGADEEILEAFARAMAVEPDYPPGHVRHGDALVRMGRNAPAQAAFERAIGLDEDFAMAHRNLGQVLLAEGEIASAITHLEAAARYDASDSVVYTSLARAYRQKGQESQAQEALTRSNTLQPVFGVPDPIRFGVEERAVDPLSLEDRIDQTLANGDVDGAMEAMDLLEESFSDDAQVLEKIGVRRFKAGRKEAAAKTLERAIALDEHRHEAHLHLGAVYDEKKDFDKALEHYEHVGQEDPTNAGLQQRIGYLYLAKNDLEHAVESMLRAAELGQDEPGLNHNLGAALDRLDRTAEAIIYFERVIAVEPENGGTHYNLGMALERLGLTARAIEHYDQAATFAPKLPAKVRAEALRAAAKAGSGG